MSPSTSHESLFVGVVLPVTAFLALLRTFLLLTTAVGAKKKSVRRAEVLQYL